MYFDYYYWHMVLSRKLQTYIKLFLLRIYYIRSSYLGYYIIILDITLYRRDYDFLITTRDTNNKSR